MNIKTNSSYCDLISQKDLLAKQTTKFLEDYLKSQCYSHAIIKEIINEEFTSSNPEYYLYYPYLFREFFNINDKSVLNYLSISGFLYYKATLLIDDIFDNKGLENKFSNFFIANICQEET